MTTAASTVTLASGLSLSYVEQGDPARPAVVFLPGPTDGLASYRSVLQHIPRAIRAIAVSQRGHGDSDKPAAGYAIEDFAGDVVPLLDALQLNRVVVAGHSGSCLVARRVAIDHPERVAGLVLEASPTTLVGNAQLESFIESVTSDLPDPIDADFARAFLVDTSSAAVEPGLLDALARDLQKVPAHVWREMFAGLARYDDTAELDHVTVPVLLIWGDADEVVSRQMQDQLALRLSRCDLLVYPGVGHTPRWQNPIRFAADVTAFVETLA